MLSTKHLPIQSSKPPKYLPKFIGPFKIIQVINSNAYKIDLPSIYSRLHNVFNITFLEPYVASSTTTPASTPHITIHDNLQYVIENIVGHKRYKKNYKFYVQWQGDSHSQATKEPVTNLISDNDTVCNKLLDYLTHHDLLTDFQQLYPRYKLN